MDRLAIIEAESHRFAEVLAAADPAARCPTCPDWSASDLLWHLTSVHNFWAGVLSRHILDEADLVAVEAAKPDRPDEQAALLRLREEATAALLRQLAGEASARAVRASGGKPSAVVSAPVGDLALWAWTRGGSVSISGEPAARGALDALMSQGIQ
jgi:uncharacterized damage-inducible protein DinB